MRETGTPNVHTRETLETGRKKWPNKNKCCTKNKSIT